MLKAGVGNMHQRNHVLFKILSNVSFQSVGEHTQKESWNEASTVC